MRWAVLAGSGYLEPILVGNVCEEKGRVAAWVQLSQFHLFEPLTISENIARTGEHGRPQAGAMR